MKHLSLNELAAIVVTKREEKHLTQAQLSEITGIHRTMIGRIEREDYIPTIPQLEKLAEVLGFEPDLLFIEDTQNDQNEKSTDTKTSGRKYRIAVAGTGYVGLSIATLLSQHHEVTAVDIVPEKVEMLNKRISPIQDEYIEKYLKEKDLHLSATLDAKAAYRDADFVVVAAPTNYDSVKNYFDTSAVEAVIELVLETNPTATIIIKSTIPVGYTKSIREKYHTNNILFSPEFLCESKALYDNLYPSRIIVVTDTNDPKQYEAAQTFAELLLEGALKENIDTRMSQLI